MSESSDPSFSTTETLIKSMRRDLGEISKRVSEADGFAREAQATLWEVERRHNAPARPSLEPPASDVAGWSMVPVEPTEAMLKAAFVAMNRTPGGEWKRMKAEGKSPREIFDAKMKPRYAALIAAAPPVSEGKGAGRE